MSSKVYDRISDPERCFVIAEIGSNHDGDFDNALRLMDIAREADADAVKFQSFLADQLVKPDSKDYPMLKKLELPREWYARLKQEAAKRDLVFFSTATNDTTLGWMQEIDVELYKIASPNLNHIPLITHTASIGAPMILSTGMADLAEIAEAANAVEAAGNRQYALLHCVSRYPCPPEAVNLESMRTMQQAFNCPVGYSDHTMGASVPLGAVAMGARVIEKHLTLGRDRNGPDHHYAAEPEEFIAMTHMIRELEQARGSARIGSDSAERELAEQYRRSLHASTSLPAGTVLEQSHLAVIRPNDGLHPRHLPDVLGMTLASPVEAGEAIDWKHFRNP